MKRPAAALLALVLCQDALLAQLTVTVKIPQDFPTLAPMTVPVSCPPELAKTQLWTAAAGPKGDVLAQLTEAGLLTEHIKAEKPGQVRRDLHFILHDKYPKATTLTLSFAPAKIPDIELPSFFWKDTKGEFADLFFGKRPVMRYMYKAYDDSSADIRNRTYKVFHHLWDPTGKRLVTNGGHTNADATDPKKLLYPHHRGLQMGFNRCTYGDGKKADTWHCQKDDHQSHQGFLQNEAGPVMGRHRVAIDWHGAKKEVFAREEREMTVYNLPGGTMVEFAARVKTADGKVKLDGDPQHAGFQFRAHNDVAAKTAKQTYYLRPDGKGEPGKTRNWPGDKAHVNLPWNALSFVLDGQRYSVAYLDHPKNPRPSRHSERDYGRFGCYFEYEITKDRPLVVNYRIWLQEGEMTREQVHALSTSFTGRAE
jgi:hypothetical protein